MQRPEFDTTSPAYSQLCELRQALQPQFAGSLRPVKDAMAEACKRRPDLAAAALKPAIHRGQSAKPGGDALIRAAEKAAADWRG